MSGARDAIARLRQIREHEQAPRELLLSRRHARLLVDMQRPGHDTAPLDYAPDDETPPFEARPMFFTCERVLIAALAIVGLLALWIGFGG